MRRFLTWQAAVLLMFLGLATWAEEEDYREAIRAEVEQLRITDRLSVGEVDVASGDLLAEIYERRANGAVSSPRGPASADSSR
jgi:hypothetical protein